MAAETLLAALGLAACLVLLARMAIGARRRRRLDEYVQRAARALQLRARTLWRQRRLRDQAEREADALIDRARSARREVDREGNVYRPRSFNGGSSEDGAPDGRQRKDH